MLICFFILDFDKIIVFLCIGHLRFFDAFGEVDVILGLGVGNVAQMGIEQVVVVESNLEHLVYAAQVGRHVAVGAHQKGIFFATGRQRPQIGHIFLEILTRHLHAVFNARACHEHADGAHLFARNEDCHQRQMEHGQNNIL